MKGRVKLSMWNCILFPLQKIVLPVSLCGFLVHFGYSQKTTPSLEWISDHIIAIESIAPDTRDFSDLAPLKKVLADTQIVLLGEQSHGEGSAYAAKVRLVKFLHQKMGFEVVAFESGMYDCAKIAQQMKLGSTLMKEKKNSMFYMYSNSVETAHLLQYIDAHKNTDNPLLFTGMDSQHTGEKSQNSMIDDLRAFLEEHYSNIPNSGNWALFSEKSAEIFKMKKEVSENDKLIFYQVLNAVKEELRTIGPEDGDALMEHSGFWSRIVASLESQAKRYWGDVEDMDRDRHMAKNMVWLANHAFKGKKIVVWAHNFHIAKNVANVKPMGHFLKNEFQEKMYTMGFTGYHGAYIDFVSGKTVKIKKPAKESFEYMVNRTGIENGIIDFKQSSGEEKWIGQEQEWRLVNFNTFTAVLPHVFDGIFYIKKAIPTEQRNIE